MSRGLPLLLSLLFASARLQAANVTVELSPIARGDVATVTAHLVNDSDEDAVWIDLKIGLGAPKGTALIPEARNPWPCRPGDCGAQNPPYNTVLRAHQSVDLVFYIQPANEGIFDLTAWAQWWRGAGQPVGLSAQARQTAIFERQLFVAQSGDSGPGSLREVLEASRKCAADEVPCRVIFRIDEPVPEEGWFTIRPQTPLPRFGESGVLILDATTQSAFSGDTNPAGPEVVIDGSALTEGNGLEIFGVGAVVIRGFAIGGFPWNGIEASFNGAAIEDNYIGTDATGLHPLSNGSRGISALSYVSNVRIARNLISANGRSGIFIEGGSDVSVIDNRIGVTSGGAPLPNGASGIYFGLRANYCSVAANRIAYNRHFGLAISRRSNHIHVAPDNSIAHNESLGIDFGVDGPSGDRFDDYNTTEPYIPPPKVVSARYNPDAGTTTITGSYMPSPDHWGRFIVSIYANDVDEAQGDVFLGTAEANAEGELTLVVPRDLRGKYIAAYAQRELHLGWSGDYFWTSEFSEKAVAVE